MMMEWLTIVLALAVITWTVLPLVRHEAWWIRSFDFPRIQLLIITAITLVLFVGWGGWHGWVGIIVALGLIACGTYQLLCIAPYTALWPCQLKSTAAPNMTDVLSIVSANVLTPNRNADDLLSIVRSADPDILLAIETDRWWGTRLDELLADYPHSVKYPLDNLYGMHLYSRLRLIEPGVRFLVEDDKPSIHTQVELRSGKRIQLHCLHPAPPAPNENNTSQERDAELIVVAKSINDHALPTIVVGDLNDVAWSATTRLFQKISGLLDPRVGRGMFNTFHASYPLIRWPLDHVFCSSDFTLVSLKRLAYFGSDHFPIHVNLQYTPGAEAEHNEPAASDAEHDWADEKIDKVRNNPDAYFSAKEEGSLQVRLNPSHNP